MARKVKFTLGIGFHGCDREDTYPLSELFDEAEFDAMTPEEQEKALNEELVAWQNEYIDGHAEIIEGEE
jgi:hypothetical protein